MTSELSTFFQTKTGQRIITVFENISEELRALRQALRPEPDPIPPPGHVLARWSDEPDDYFVDRHKEGPWSFEIARPEYSETVFFHRGEMGWHFWGTIGGKSRDEIEFMAISGDAGNDAFLSRQKMTLLAFAKWVGYSHPGYLFEKSDTRKEFNWAQARCDWEEYAQEREKELREEDGEDSDSVRRFASLVEAIDETLNIGDYNSQQTFAEAFYSNIYADGDDEFDLNSCLSECDWGMCFSAQAYARWRQARYFALWLEAREMLRGQR